MTLTRNREGDHITSLDFEVMGLTKPVAVVGRIIDHGNEVTSINKEGWSSTPLAAK